MIKILALLVLGYANATFSANNAFVDFFTPLQSLRADFTQNTYNENGALISTTSGLFAFKRPQQLLWHTLNPNEQILLLDNNQLWLIDIEIEQSNQLPIDKINQSPLYWLINPPKSLTNTPNFTHQSGGIDWYQTAQKSSQYQQLQFGFKNGQLYAISLRNKLGQNVVIVFDKLSVNTDINPKVFEIDVNPVL